jgi:VWFA-related protein
VILRSFRPFGFLVLLGMLGAQYPSAQEPAQSRDASDAAVQEPPRFRAEAGFVRVDVFATQNGAAVRDLQASDFEVLEDGVLQKIAAFEHVQVQGWTPQAARREPQSVAEGRAMAEDPRTRVFIVFLDRYHTSILGSRRMRGPLVEFLNRAIGPDDLFAVMTPDMSARDIILSRRTTTVEGMLSRHWYWGGRDGMVQRDPEEQLYEMCYPPQGIQRSCRDPRDPAGQRSISELTGIGVALEMIERRREKRSLDALADLAIHLEGLREERKAVLVVSDGWRLFRPNENLARIGLCETPPGLTPVGVGPDGRLTTDTRERQDASREQCDRDRQMLADLDNWQTFRDLMDRANRANVSFYPVDSRGLAVSDTPIESPEYMTVSPSVDRSRLRDRIESLRTLAANTDGLAVVDSNDIEGGIRRIIDDLTSYYLLGYYTSNDTPDGTFRAIKVRVKREGVEVRARRGYVSPTREEIEAGRRLTTAAEQRPAGMSPVQTALQSLTAASRRQPLATHASWLAAPGLSRLWVTAELETSILRSTEWASGGVAELVVVGGGSAEETVAVAKASLKPGARAVTLDVGSVVLVPGGEYVTRLRLRPVSSGEALTDTVAFTVSDASAPVGRPQLRRRGSTTGVEYMPAATAVFRRTERVRVEVPVAGSIDRVQAELLDRNGQLLHVPVEPETRGADGVTWGCAEVALAPLAPGEYIVRTIIDIAGGRREVLTAFRIVP